MSETLIKVENLYKKFGTSLRRSMAYGTVDTLRSMFGINYNQSKLRKGEFWALQDLNFELKRGEKIGFLGENGSGKSTLLRLLNGIFPPDKGKITINASIGALIAVGAGFHPHMTGRENIYLNGTILGMTNSEIKSKFDEIIDFAEIGDFVDAPVSTYSSGMSVRLGFSIASASFVDILLVDEILAVGDLSFQLKCMRKLSEFRQSGGTFILVTHNMQMIRNSCEKVIWLEKGKIVDIGDINLCNAYEAAQLKKYSNNKSQKAKILRYDELIEITDLKILHSNLVTDEINICEPVTFQIIFKTQREIFNPIFSISMRNPNNVIVFEKYSNFQLQIVQPSVYSVSLHFEELNIRPDVYTLTITLSENEQMNKIEWQNDVVNIVFVNKKKNIEFNQGIIHAKGSWDIIKHK